MNKTDTKISKQTEEAREQVQEALAIATEMSTMLIEELDKNPELINNIKTLGEKYADVVEAIAKPIIEYSKEQELALCEAKYKTLIRHFNYSTPEEQMQLLAIAFSK